MEKKTSSSAFRLSNDELVTATRRLVSDERRITSEILVHINEVERRRLYADLGFPSLFEWLTKDLKYSAKFLESALSSSSRSHFAGGTGGWR